MNSEKNQFSGNVLKRSFRFVRDDFFVYKNTCMLKLIKVRKTREITNLQLVVNGYKINPTKQDKTWAVWDFATIRSEFRDVLGETPDEVNKIRLEDTFYYNESILAPPHYTKLTFDQLHNSILTSELQVALSFKASTVPTILEAEEEVYMSDAQLDKEKK